MVNGIIPERYVRSQVQAAWGTALNCLQEIGENHFDPNIGSELLINEKLYDEKLKHFNVIIEPIILRIFDKELKKDIIIVINGYITFDEKLNTNKLKYTKQDNKNILQATDYGTRVEIYEIDSEGINAVDWSHVFGARYEFDMGSLDHPAFHSHITDEMKLYSDYKNSIERIFRSQNLNKPVNKILGINKKIKIPTAQLDFFSVIVQICADHFLPRQGIIKNYNGKNLDNKADHFRKLIDACNFFQGVEIDFSRQNSKLDNCLRSTHWYCN